ncbi:MFS general substrate transporter [Bimuria novae-zelandiae CBS 107.79]|uniref:MFS general substrate transporter n=1 Tax=Bimuria novae-zelandiae CBS 107.79 TaxID=1447943 RepID=A0A6A5VJG2_9PLEO|nr:MFS general substrate transporter [Bimuria novae-zelandiae CBS 107.79]
MASLGMNESAGLASSELGSEHEEPKSTGASTKWRFWLTMATIASIYMFTQTAVQPPCAQLCNIFDRKSSMVTAVVIFAAGSAVAGSSKTATTLIVGRTVQGLASGCIMMLSELIVCDMVPLRERGKYVGFILSAIALGTVVGPITSGALAEHHWRWVFYMNLPICGIILATLKLFVKFRYNKEPSWAKAISRIDWPGNTLFCGSACAIMLGIIPAGSSHSWSSWRTILPITIGVAGFIAMAFFEASRFCREPGIPPRLFTNRTTVAGYFMAFISSIALQWAGFFWPVYFQMRGASPLKSAVNLLPFLLFLLLVAGVSGAVMSKIGQYRPLHAAGFTILQILNATGQGLIIPTLLPAIMASLAESDAAAATGVFSSLRSFGYAWGIVLSSIIFNNQVEKNQWRIEDSTVRGSLTGGRGYGMVSGDFVQQLPPATRVQVLDVYTRSLRSIWWAALALACVGALGVLIDKHVPLRQGLEKEYGLDSDGQLGDTAPQEKGVAPDLNSSK